MPVKVSGRTLRDSQLQSLFHVSLRLYGPSSFSIQPPAVTVLAAGAGTPLTVEDSKPKKVTRENSAFLLLFLLMQCLF